MRATPPHQGILRPTLVVVIVALFSIAATLILRPRLLMHRALGTPTHVDVEVLSGDGPTGIIGWPDLVAAHSVAELKALLHAVPDLRFHDPDGWDTFDQRGADAFLAFATGPCASVTAATATAGRGGIIEIRPDTTYSCPNAAGSAGPPRLTLLAIPSGELGRNIVTFTLANSDAAATLDLRKPDMVVSVAAIQADALAAAAAARGSLDPNSDYRLASIDIRRWSTLGTSCGMGTGRTAESIVGYSMRFVAGPSPKPQSTVFHWANGHLIRC